MTQGAASGASSLNGTVIAWGSLVPPAGLTNIVAVSKGLALRSDGTVVAWGGGGAGLPPEGLSNVVAIASGYSHRLALLSTGRVIAWGINWYGQTSVPPSLTEVVAVAAGGSHSLALKRDGTVEAWGFSGSGPGTALPGLDQVIAIAAGDAHNLALRADGTVVAWGNNESGQSSPPAGLSGVVSIAAGRQHSLAALSNGTVVAWGAAGAFGATSVPDDVERAVAVFAGDGRSMALLPDGSVRAWGFGAGTVPGWLTDVLTASLYDSGGCVLISNSMAPPRIVVEPISQRAVRECPVRFEVTARGPMPLAFQWFKGMRVLSGQTNSYLSVAKALPDTEGDYFAVVANPFGAVTSAVAQLRITTKPETNIFWVTESADAGPGTLRQAIVDANANCGGRIRFSGVTKTIYLKSDLPEIVGDLSLAAPHTNRVRVSSPFFFNFVMKAGTNSLAGLILDHALIQNGGTLTLSDCDLIVANSYGELGFRALVNSGPLSMTRCSVSNYVHSQGAGLYTTSNAVVAISESRFEQNGVLGTSAYNRETGSGGAIYVASGSLRLSRCQFLRNRAAGSRGQGFVEQPGDPGGSARGGAIAVFRGTVEASDCTFQGNSAYGGDGGNGKYSGGDAGGAFGGACYVASSAIFKSCTFSLNRVEGATGGSANRGSGAKPGLADGSALFHGGEMLTIMNCTFSGNRAKGGLGGSGNSFGQQFYPAYGGNGRGGAIFSATGCVDVAHCTLVENVALGPPGEIIRDLFGSVYRGGDGTGEGGGIFARNSTVELGNSILAQNTVIRGETNPPVASDADGNFLSNAHNLIGATNLLIGLLPSDLVGVDPRLSPLRDNGGPTLTHMPLTGSPAIDAGTNLNVLLDQRGRRRLADSRYVDNPAGADGTDIGAVEADQSMSFQAVSILGTDVRIQFTSDLNAYYGLLFKDDLELQPWVPLPQTVSGTGGLATFTDTNAARLPKRFYRLFELPR